MQRRQKSQCKVYTFRSDWVWHQWIKLVKSKAKWTPNEAREFVLCLANVALYYNLLQSESTDSLEIYIFWVSILECLGIFRHILYIGTSLFFSVCISTTIPVVDLKKRAILWRFVVLMGEVVRFKTTFAVGRIWPKMLLKMSWLVVSSPV